MDIIFIGYEKMGGAKTQCLIKGDLPGTGGRRSFSTAQPVAVIA